MSKAPPRFTPVFAYDRKPEERNTRQTQTALEALGPLSGALDIQEVTLAVGDNLVYHGLGHAPQYRLVFYQSAAANLYDKTITAKTWTINASAATVVRLAFF